jgi:hypothetical protein
VLLRVPRAAARAACRCACRVLLRVPRAAASAARAAASAGRVVCCVCCVLRILRASCAACALCWGRGKVNAMGYMGIVIAAMKLLVAEPSDLQSRVGNLMVVGFFQIIDRAWLTFFFLDMSAGVCLSVVHLLPPVRTCPAAA